MARRSRSLLQVVTVLGLVAAAGVLPSWTFTQPGPPARRDALLSTAGALLGLTSAASSASAAGKEDKGPKGGMLFAGQGGNGAVWGDEGTSWRVVLDPSKTDSDKAWQGRYKDPNHPGCTRVIYQGEDGLRLRLIDGQPGCLAGEQLTFYELKVNFVEKKSTLDIDFSPKGGPAKVTAKYVPVGNYGGLQFPDGNTWTRISPGANIIR